MPHLECTRIFSIVLKCAFPCRQEERKNAMLMLIRITREGNSDVWEEHFKTILLLLLETLGDNDVST